MWVEFVVGFLLCSKRFFSRVLWFFPSPQKPTFQNSNSTRNIIDEEPLSGCGTSLSLYIFIIIIIDSSSTTSFDCQLTKVPSPCSCTVENLTITVLPERIILHLFKVEELYFIGYNMTTSARKGRDASVLTYHRIIEAFKFGYAWCSRLGDPAFNMDKKISEVGER